MRIVEKVWFFKEIQYSRLSQYFTQLLVLLLPWKCISQKVYPEINWCNSPTFFTENKYISEHNTYLLLSVLHKVFALNICQVYIATTLFCDGFSWDKNLLVTFETTCSHYQSENFRIKLFFFGIGCFFVTRCQ